MLIFTFVAWLLRLFGRRDMSRTVVDLGIPLSGSKLGRQCLTIGPQFHLIGNGHTEIELVRLTKAIPV